MSIRHKKISTVLNNIPGKASGGDWNDEHVYGIGDIVTIGLVRVEYAAGTQEFFVGPETAIFTSHSTFTGAVRFDLALPDIPVVAGAVVDYVAQPAPLVAGVLPAGSYIDTSIYDLTIAPKFAISFIDDTDADFNPAVDVTIWVTIYAVIAAA